MIRLGQDFCPLVSLLSFFPSNGERRMDKRQRAMGTVSWGSAAIERLSTWAGGGFTWPWGIWESVMGRVKTQPCPSRMEPGTVVIQALPVLSLGVGAVRRGREIRGKGLPDTIWESLCKEWKVTRWEHWHFAPLSQCRICLWRVQRAVVFYLVMGSTWKPFQTLRAWLRDYKRFCGLERKVGKPLV